ncbi:MAG: DUF4870 domain-containing protein [Anaerolineales bacterium]
MLNERMTEGVTQDERNWAMLAHLTALLTVFTAVATGGPGYIVALLVPLALYLYFSGRSEYAAYHALQATVFQALAGIVYVVVAALAGTVIATAWAVTGVLTVVLVGVALVPVAFGLTLIAAVELLGLPVLLVAYALRGAFLVSEGHEFAYPLVGEVVARSLRRGGGVATNT